MWFFRSAEQKKQDEKFAKAVREFKTLSFTRHSMSIEVDDIKDELDKSRKEFKQFVLKSA